MSVRTDGGRKVRPSPIREPSAASTQMTAAEVTPTTAPSRAKNHSATQEADVSTWASPGRVYPLTLE